MPHSPLPNCPHCAAVLSPGDRSCHSCGRSLETERDLYSGKVLLGKYRCIERIGSGATSQVFKAQHARLASPRAIKIMRPELKNDAGAVERFWREAHVASLLRHPNVAILHDVDALPDATPCSIWEYIDGPSLADRVARAPLAADTSHVIRGLCNAVELLHRKGWAHLDLCPQNILLGTGEHELEAHVIDFGEARVQGSPGERGHEELRPGYSAPEQVLGSGALDSRADVFALGALICFAFTGHPPLVSPNLATYGDWLRRLDPGKLRSLEALPAPLRQIVQRCLDPNPERRPVDAGALRDQIKRLARESGVEHASPAVASELATAMVAPSAERPPAGRLPAEPTVPHEIPELPPNEVSAELLTGNMTNPMAPDGMPLIRFGNAAAMPAARLELISGVDNKSPITIGALVSIGRSASCGAVVDHPTVSKHHGQIRWDGSVFVFEDLGSRNGSTIGGKRVTAPTPLKSGDRLILGEVVMRFKTGTP